MAARRKEKIVVVINKTTIITMTFKRILYRGKYRYTYRGTYLRSSRNIVLRRFLDTTLRFAL